ncbi:MAG: alcohol dehydrogenase catalytic domain-containing protein [bacterium]|nr:alcohol dehydrogenase catalytic domain-containing protein [bacterium]MDE0351863.1 alcohol dehydrogenase catalytic domain-containing protein [bacterium]
MRAAVYHGARDIRIERLPVPIPGPGELLLEVRSSGVCGTDALEWDRGPILTPVDEPHPVSGHRGPTILGHEFGGRVVDLGPEVEGFGAGDLVACVAGISCGACAACMAGTSNFCDTYFTLGIDGHGGLARYVAAGSAACLEVGRLGLDDDGAALVQPMSVALHAVRQGRLRPGETAVVLGVGGVGAFLAYAAAQLGADVLAVDFDPARLAVAEALGVSAVLRAVPDSSPVPGVLEHTGSPVSVVYEVTGAPAALASALDMVRPRGRVVRVGLGAHPVTIDMRRITLREIRLVGTRAQVFETDFADAASLIASRPQGWSDVAPIALPLEQLVTDGLLPMAEGRPERIKTLIDPWATAIRPASGARLGSIDRLSQRSWSG